MSGQCFKQDRGQGHCKNNATSNQNFKHDCGYIHPQDLQRNSTGIFSGFHFGFPYRIPTLILTV